MIEQLEGMMMNVHYICLLAFLRVVGTFGNRTFIWKLFGERNFFILLPERKKEIIFYLYSLIKQV